MGADNPLPWPADAVERRPVAALVPYARNARTHSPAQVDQIAASIREWGWTVPVLIDETGGIIAGHGRILAAQKLGIADVPTMVALGWSEARKRAYVLADNKLTLNGGWDDELLRLELSDLKLEGFDLGLTGFAPGELSGLLDRIGGLTDPDATPEPPAQPVSRLGDVWLLGRHRLVCGDATKAEDVALALGAALPHLMVTDPPYGVSYDPSWRNDALEGPSSRRIGTVLNDDRADWREAWALFPGDVAYVWHGALHAATVAESLAAAGFSIRSQIIWKKPSLVLGRGDYHWQHEPCWYAVRDKKTGHWAGDRKQTTIWEISGKAEDSATVHGTQKPAECMARAIRNNSSAGQTIYEPFSGSGTTIIACESEGRACHAIELHPPYVDVGIQRWQSFTGQSAFHENGRSFADIMTIRQTC